MEEKKYLNPDEARFADRGWARDEHGFKIKESQSISKKTDAKVKISEIRKVSITNKEVSEPEKIATLKLTAGVHLISINAKWSIGGSVSGTYRSGQLKIVLSSNDIELSKYYAKINNQAREDSWTWTIAIDEEKEYNLSLSSTSSGTAVPITNRD